MTRPDAYLQQPDARHWGLDLHHPLHRVRHSLPGILRHFSGNQERGNKSLLSTELSFLSNCTFCARESYIGVYKKCSLIKMNHPYDECQTQSAKVLALARERACQEDTNHTSPPLCEFQIGFPFTMDRGLS